MKISDKLKKTEQGVSPVIAVILMVAVTVALVTLVTVVVFNIGGDVSESPDATVNLEVTSGGLQATVLRNENVDSFRLVGPNGNQSNFAGDPGTSTTINDGTGRYNVIAIMPDGSEEVLTSTDINELSTGGGSTGTTFNFDPNITIS